MPPRTPLATAPGVCVCMQLQGDDYLAIAASFCWYYAPNLVDECTSKVEAAAYNKYRAVVAQLPVAVSAEFNGRPLHMHEGTWRSVGGGS